MDLDSLVAAAAALGGVAIGAWMEGRRLRQAASEKRRDDAAAILAPVEALIQDAHPQRLTMFDPQRHQAETMPDLRRRWEAQKEQLLRLSIGHPAKEVRDLSERLVVTLHNSLVTTSLLLNDVVASKTERDDHTEAMTEYRAAHETSRELADAIWKVPPPWWKSLPWSRKRA